MKKRILQFIGSFHQGGSERQAVALTRMLQNEGSFETFAATLNNDGVLRADIEGIGLPEIAEFPLTSFYNAAFVRQVRRCAKYLRDNKIDLVHTHDFYTNVFGMAAATLAGVGGRVASKRETRGMRSTPQVFIEKLAFGRVNAIVVNCVAVREHLIRSGITPEKISVIYNGIDLDRFEGRDQSAIRQKLNLPDGDNIRFVTMVANLRHDVKNIPMLLRCAKRIIETRPGIHFGVAGEGELELELKETANQMSLGKHIHFIGRCTDVPALLSLSDACVLTSTAEGFSNSILEYMAAGKPVVATNVGGAAEAIMNGESGYLVASDDDAAMANHLIRLLDDKKRATEMGMAGRRIVEEKFSLARQLAETSALYEESLRR